MFIEGKKIIAEAEGGFGIDVWKVGGRKGQVTAWASQRGLQS